jgi:prevent-host-death family protein
MKAGTKELKNRLSHYLRVVRSGETVDVTDRGEVVAHLHGPRKARSPSDEAVLAALERDGVLTRGRGRRVDFEPVRPKKRRGNAPSQMIIEDRD